MNWTDILGYGTTGASIGTQVNPGWGTAIGAGLGLGAGLLKGYLAPDQTINYQNILDKYRRLLQSQYSNVFKQKENALKREYQARGLSSSPALMAGLSRLKADQARTLENALNGMALQRAQAQEGDEKARLAQQYQNYQQMWGQTIPTAATQIAYGFNPPKGYGSMQDYITNQYSQNDKLKAMGILSQIEYLLNSPNISAGGKDRLQSMYKYITTQYPDLLNQQ